MYKVKWKDAEGIICEEEAKDLALALAIATALGIPVTINGSGIEIIGTFGADSVNNGMLPNGTEYNWYKRRQPSGKENHKT